MTNYFFVKFLLIDSYDKGKRKEKAAEITSNVESEDETEKKRRRGFCKQIQFPCGDSRSSGSEVVTNRHKRARKGQPTTKPQATRFPEPKSPLVPCKFLAGFLVN